MVRAVPETPQSFFFLGWWYTAQFLVPEGVPMLLIMLISSWNHGISWLFKVDKINCSNWKSYGCKQACAQILNRWYMSLDKIPWTGTKSKGNMGSVVAQEAKISGSFLSVDHGGGGIAGKVLSSSKWLALSNCFCPNVPVSAVVSGVHL